MQSNKDKLLMGLINKGGSIPKGDPSVDPVVYVQLRPPKWVIAKIDEICTREPGIYRSRHNWIMQAILSALAKEGDNK
jgi:hypothetical protein